MKEITGKTLFLNKCIFVCFFRFKFEYIEGGRNRLPTLSEDSLAGSLKRNSISDEETLNNTFQNLSSSVSFSWHFFLVVLLLKINFFIFSKCDRMIYRAPTFRVKLGVVVFEVFYKKQFFVKKLFFSIFKSHFGGI